MGADEKNEKIMHK